MTGDWVVRGFVATLHALARGGCAVLSVLLLAAHVALMVPGFGLGLVFLLPWPFVVMRRATNAVRRLSGGVPLPYLPRPPAPAPEPDGRYQYNRRLYRSPFWPRQQRYLEWTLGDQATWRDIGWMVANPVVGGLLGFAPAALVLGGLAAVMTAAVGFLPWWALVPGLAAATAGLATAPALVRAHDAWARRILGPPQTRIGSLKAWLGIRLLALLRMLALAGLAVVSALLAVASLAALTASCLGFVVALPPVVRWTRAVATVRRRLADRWSGVRVDQPYRPEPALPPLRPDGLYEVGGHLYRSRTWTRYHQQLSWLRRDPATWRDMSWTAADPIVGGALVLGSVGALAYGFLGLVIAGLLHIVHAPEPPGLRVFADRPWLAVVTGVALAVAGVLAAPAALRAHGRWTAVLLAPTAEARLNLRVQQLTESRADATQAQAAELRRIERDLHDGAQARLVALGLALGTIEQLVEQDPAGARRMLVEARQTSAKALTELRDLVRGIHPPVLAERGLVDAVRALALDAPLPTTVTADLPGRPPEPVEAAVYFAVNEALANAGKHAGAARVAVTIDYDGSALRVTVGDDGCGGADPTLGSGLRGVRHRLAAFDGTVRVSSPTGGPTLVVLEVPCALSSPRTSIS
ncbi:sensor histidine kinase [Micromonospora sp. NPDC050686]|uniref:sensor histidine kinase n=1 Tax=Micromonospora sp. NPDC050686 TaxID=3154631 RepID=UPI0033D1F499